LYDQRKQAVLVTTASGEPRGIELTEETFEPSGLVLMVSGELDIATAPTLRDRLGAAIDGGTHRLVIDLSAISFLDSVALATIVHAKQRLPEHGRMAIVIDPASYVMLVFESGGLRQVLDLVETRSQAMALVSS
jgi:anti-sigma B factor antagonist